MILEIEEDLRDFATVYKKDYPQKEAEKLTKYRSLIDCPPPFNVLSGPYKQYLNTRLENQLLPHTEQSEDPEDNLNRIRDKFPHLRKTLPQIVPDENVVGHEKKISRRSVYQVDYLKEFGKRIWLHYRLFTTYRLYFLQLIYMENDIVILNPASFFFLLSIKLIYKGAKTVYEYSNRQRQKYHVVRDVKLPEDWVIPETLQKRSYRNPWIIATKDLLKRPKSLKPRNNLDPDITERAILRVTTGNSEYIDTIGAIGEKIMQQSSSELQERVRSQVITKSS